MEISHALARREIVVAQQFEHPVAVPDIRARHDLRCERIIAFDACGMVLFEEFVARADIFAAGLENLVALFEENRLRIERDSLAVIFRGFPIILKMLPMRPPEVSPNHREFRIEPGAFFPLGDRPLRNLVVKEIAEIVMNLPVVGMMRFIFSRTRAVSSLNALENGRSSASLKYFSARALSPDSSAKFPSHIFAVAYPVFASMYSKSSAASGGKPAPLVGERELYVRFRARSRISLLKSPPPERISFSRAAKAFTGSSASRLFGGFESRIFFALGAENGGFKVERWNVAGVVRQSLVEPLDGGVEISARGINLRKLRVAAELQA